jgi:hypothetical protein
VHENLNSPLMELALTATIQGVVDDDTQKQME